MKFYTIVLILIYSHIAALLFGIQFYKTQIAVILVGNKRPSAAKLAIIVLCISLVWPLTAALAIIRLPARVRSAATLEDELKKNIFAEGTNDETD